MWVDVVGCVDFGFCDWLGNGWVCLDLWFYWFVVSGVFIEGVVV